MFKLQKLFLFPFLFSILFYSSGYSQDMKQIKLKAKANEFKVVTDIKNKDILKITTSISFINVQAVPTKEGNFIALESAGLVKIYGKGEPNLPVFSKLIEVPLKAKVKGTILGSDDEIVKFAEHDITQKIIPAQPSLSKNEDPAKVPFYFNREIYEKDKFLEQKVITFEDLGIMRNVRLVRIQVSPMLYNPVQNQLKILNNLNIKIEFIDPDHVKTRELREIYSSVLFDRLFERIVSNFDFRPLFKDKITYVIVSDRMFEETLQSFIQWKEALGYNVIEAYTDDPIVGNTTASIKNYLKDLYDTPPFGVRPPHYVLLVGDVEQIPAFNGNDDHVTDLYYCEYTGDSMPEVFYGRFSATSEGELQPQIDKTILYEKHTMSNPSYMFNAVLVAGADATHATTWGNGQINYANDQYFNTTNGWTEHEYLQPEPAGGNYSTSIQTDISNGIGFAIYTAHCSPSGWSNPSFITNDIPNLNNKDKYGLWIGNCCRSNRFNVAECFGEAALRTADKGALGYIGATNYTYWDEDFWWATGFKTVTVNPNYDANHLGALDRLFHSQGEATTDWYSSQGQMLVGGNLAVQESTSLIKTYYWEIYNLMGDPSLEIRTAAPETFDVVHPVSAPISFNNFVVAVKQGFIMIPDATVTLVKDNQVLGSKKTEDTYPDKGTAKFAYSSTTGTMYIYVTKLNYIPYIGECELGRGTGSLWVSLHGGATYPFEDWYEDTFCFNSIVNIEYRFRFRYAFVAEFAYNEFIWYTARERYPWWNFSGTMRYFIPIDRFPLFINVGPGLYIPDKGKARLGLKAGVGINYPLNDRLMLEAGTDYHMIFPGSKASLYQDKHTSFQHFHIGLVYKLTR